MKLSYRCFQINGQGFHFRNWLLCDRFYMMWGVTKGGWVEMIEVISAVTSSQAKTGPDAETSEGKIQCEFVVLATSTSNF